MKQTITLVALLLTLGISSAKGQAINFKADSTGVFKTLDNKNFIVISESGKSAKQLYDEVMYGILTKYNSPKEIIQYSIDGNYIVINDVANMLAETWTDTRIWYDFTYRLGFQFKDGKIRVEAPSIIGGYLRIGAVTKRSPYYDNFVLTYLYKTDKTQIPKVEGYFNKLLESIISEKKNNDNW